MRHQFLKWGQALIEQGTWSWLFAPISWVWQAAVFCKNFSYAQGWRKTFRVAPVVVSIGNIVAGGTGKTPFTQLLASHFSHRKVAVLLRGYGRDEELLHAKWAKVYVGKDRVKQALRAEQDGMELILLDDGFQHRRLARDIDIVLLRGEDPLGKSHFLPWGFLRDDPKRLQSADLLFLKGIDFVPKAQKNELQSGDRVALFSGIAQPASFRRLIDSLGVEVLDELRLADHEQIAEKTLTNFANNCKSIGCKFLVTTEKDFVKLPEPQSFSLPIVCIEITLQLQGQGREKWKKLVATIEEKLDNRRHVGTSGKDLFTEAGGEHSPCDGGAVVQKGGRSSCS